MFKGLEVRSLLLKMSAIEWTDVGCGYSVMMSTSGNEALDKGHAISYVKAVKDCRIQYDIGTVELGKFVRYIESSLYRTPRFNELSKKQPKCSFISRYS